MKYKWSGYVYGSDNIQIKHGGEVIACGGEVNNWSKFEVIVDDTNQLEFTCSDDGFYIDDLSLKEYVKPRTLRMIRMKT